MSEESQPKKKSSFMSTWKDIVALLRDTSLLALLILLLAFPMTFNDLLVSAGFEEGSIVGFKWRAKLVNSDLALKEIQANNNDLTRQNENLSKALADIQEKINDPTEKVRLAELVEENNKLQQASAKVAINTQLTIASNAALVERAQTATAASVQWGVVYGGDTNLDAAKYEIGAVAQKYGLTNASIFFRQGSFRSVATASDRTEAEQLLLKAKSRRRDAYIVNLNNWCPRTEQKAEYSECINP
ncbi:MAG: hypothetical protein KJ884_15805 [Gammaproteobacteria bacterium]|nr:hypothetical protein [Gammaproteobacteria bacterium]MBU1489168.1 hypothetical protein [Gammaproteobacteria bacterium]MBU2065281.1 hypothetical protein [Gammaproteobacteria bacterium]MBU2139405.1 hypothetical protein [Gammaproteobacteria bacterium]MBU2218593.1 hypothetical protein [Gammaproteobacteria bacterium]